MNKEFILTETLRLKKYLEHVAHKLNTTTGEMKEFWKREQKRTATKLEKLG